MKKDKFYRIISLIIVILLVLSMVISLVIDFWGTDNFTTASISKGEVTALSNEI